LQKDFLRNHLQGQIDWCRLLQLVKYNIMFNLKQFYSMTIIYTTRNVSFIDKCYRKEIT